MQAGVFIWGDATQSYYLKRDKAIPNNVLLSTVANFGLLGSDVLGEAPNSDVAAEKLMPVTNLAGQPLRFAIATRDTAQDVKTVKSKLANNEPLRIATSYPNTAVRELSAIGIRAALTPEGIQPGGIEALLWQFKPQLDAIFEVVQSGDSLRDNNLTMIQDDIMPVDLLRITKAKLLKGEV